jgi:hypothetical protein
MSASVRVMTWARSFLASSSSPRARNASARRRRAYTQDTNVNHYKAAFLILRAEPIRPNYIHLPSNPSPRLLKSPLSLWVFAPL